jgi:hypothetical protein
MRRRYDFRIGERLAGSYILEDDGSELRQYTTFETDDGARYENRHEVRYRGNRALAYRTGDGAWVDISSSPADHFPTAAFPLVIRSGLSAYVAIDEESGATSQRTMERAGGRLVEREGERVARQFEEQSGRITWIDWGGATSTWLEE